MVRASLVFLLFLLLACSEQKVTTGQLSLVWESGNGFKTPESVLWYPDENVFFVSNINSQPAAKDGNGFISKLRMDGSVLELKWGIGLDAPKGMVILDGYLFVTDIDRLVKFNLLDGSIARIYSADQAGFLNDVAVDDSGRVYVSDMSDGNSVIYRLEKDVLDIWLSGAEQVSRPNGLYYMNGWLYFGNSGTGQIKKVNVTSHLVEVVAGAGHGIDGLKLDGQGRFIISDWSGKTELIQPGTAPVLLLDTSSDQVNSADFEYVIKENLLVIPTFGDNRVMTYRLKK